MITFVLLAFFAYLCGSLSSAVMVCKVMGFPDPRSSGSNNPGATNVLRIAGKQAAGVVLMADCLKGFLPVVLSRLFPISYLAIGLIAVAAIVGHMYPLFFKFQGGKGVATAGGALLAMSWVLGGASLLLWVLVAGVTRYASLASLVATAFAPVLCLWLSASAYVLPLGIIVLLIFWRHRENIDRLIDGSESKIGF